MQNKNNEEQNLNPESNSNQGLNSVQFNQQSNAQASDSHGINSGGIEFENNDEMGSRKVQAQDNFSERNVNGNQNFQSSNHETIEHSNSAMHFFMYMVSFFSLMLFSTGVGTIIFQIINKNISDNLRYDYAGYFAKTAVKYGIATILIAMPIYFVLMYFINKKIFQGEINIHSKVRKWLTYIILFIASAIIIGDLIALVFYMLDGDLTTRFILKVVTVIVIAGFIFGYYLWDMKKENAVGVAYMANKIFALVAIVISIIVLLSSFFVIDSPKAARDKKIDSQTLSALSSLSANITIYYDTNNELPADLNELEISSYEKRNLDSLEEPVTYKKIDANNYELCANFKRKTEEESNVGYGYGYTYENEWDHTAGNYCFSKEVTNKKKSNSQIPTSNYNNNSSYLEGMEAARERAVLASIKSSMSSTVPAAVICKDGDGKIVSGSGGSQMCDNAPSFQWPEISPCGPSPESTKWIVGITGEGENVEWDITLNCEQFTKCNSSINAVCTEGGCNFSGTCQ